MQRGKPGLYLQLIRWDRPAGWLLLLWPTLSALWVAAGGFPGWQLLLVFTLGTFLMRSAGCCLNDVADRDFDRHVKRTAQRPVTRGAVSVKEALVLGAALALAAFALVLSTNAATIAWSFVALAVAVAYPYSKRFFAMPQAGRQSAAARRQTGARQETRRGRECPGRAVQFRNRRASRPSL